MKTSNAGLMFIAGLEGLCQTKYYDSVGVQTIGVGATVSEIHNIKEWPWDKELSIKECFNMLQKSVVKYEKAVDKTLKVGTMLSQSQYDALVSICYNIGTGGLAKSTFMKRINAGDSAINIAAAILMWDKPKEIIGRRTKEAKLYTRGIYAGEGKVLVFPVSSSHKPLYGKGYEINAKEYLV